MQCIIRFTIYIVEVANLYFTTIIWLIISDKRFILTTELSKFAFPFGEKVIIGFHVTQLRFVPDENTLCTVKYS